MDLGPLDPNAISDHSPGWDEIAARDTEDHVLGEQSSHLGLDEDHGFFHKLGQFLATLIVGPLIGLLLLAALLQPMDPVWRVMARAVVETLVLFWLLLLVFIWWRPRWLRRVYVSTERKVILFASLASLACLLLIVFEAITGLLREAKIL